MTGGDAKPPCLRRSLVRLAMATAAVLVVGLLAGYLFGRTAPERAASAILGGQVTTEPLAGDDLRHADTAEPAPTSGDHVGQPACGWLDAPAGPDTQLATLSAGLVVVQYLPGGLTAGSLDDLRSFAQQHRVTILVAPNAQLTRPVVATAWRHRLPLDGVDIPFLRAFLTAYGGEGPRPGTCREGL